MLIDMNGHSRPQRTVHPFPCHTINDLLNRELLTFWLFPVKQGRGNPDFIRDFDGNDCLHVPSMC